METLLEFSPTMSASEVDKYFRANLPDGVTMQDLNSGISCLRDARLILIKLGGKEKARIMWLYNEQLEDGHAYVCLIDADDNEISYGNESTKIELVTNGYLRLHAEDLTFIGW